MSSVWCKSSSNCSATGLAGWRRAFFTSFIHIKFYRELTFITELHFTNRAYPFKVPNVIATIFLVNRTISELGAAGIKEASDQSSLNYPRETQLRIHLQILRCKQDPEEIDRNNLPKVCQ